MPAILKRCNCDCSTTNSPCGCECAPGLECRTMGGTALLIGNSEFVTPSVPPKKYRRRQNAGASTSNFYTDSNCTSLDHIVSCTYDGWCQYDKATGNQTSGGGVTCNGSPQSSGCVSLLAACDSALTTTKTVKARSSTNACCPSFGIYGKVVSESATETLSDEDTESDALKRLLNSAVWSPWKAYDSLLCPSCCTASWEYRVTGFTFIYVKAEWRFHRTDLKPNTHYKITVSFERRLYTEGDDKWEQYDTRILEFDTGPAAPGAATVEHTEEGGEIPNTKGYSTRVRSCAKADLS